MKNIFKGFFKRCKECKKRLFALFFPSAFSGF